MTMKRLIYVKHNAAHPIGYTFDVPEGHDYWLLVLTHTASSFWVDETWISYPAGSAALFAPGMKILYRAHGDMFENDWLRFSSDETYVTSLPIKGVPFAVSDPHFCHGIFCQLSWELERPQENSAETIDKLIQSLFMKLHEAAKANNRIEVSSHYHALTELRKAIYHDPKNKWRVHEMAEQTHLSEGHFQYIYRKTFGVSCVEDVIQSRIHAAKSLLQYTNKTIAQIAEFCGYNNVEHFCRQFRKVAKMTPSNYRKAIRLENIDKDNSITLE